MKLKDIEEIFSRSGFVGSDITSFDNESIKLKVKLSSKRVFNIVIKKENIKDTDTKHNKKPSTDILYFDGEQFKWMLLNYDLDKLYKNKSYGITLLCDNCYRQEKNILKFRVDGDLKYLCKKCFKELYGV